MHRHFLRSLAVLTNVFFFWLAAVDAAAGAETAVDLELVLAVDVSGSMDEDEHTLQRRGYVAAFHHPQVINAITSGFLGRIAVTYVEWAGPTSQVVTVPWRIIDGEARARAFADDLAAAPSPSSAGLPSPAGSRSPPACLTATGSKVRGA